ncbi:hypothetical protein SAMN02745117_00433 [Lampropedia hyalina DSM 16112]|jgi:predicted alpha/beta superfamily hydrolase|uniref:Acyl-CoA:diacylglycerol acyltransferase n=1 Tax=Lampropedia hyalina DSM 16112 TaxID=1122156 RepID=A0A1M4U4T9_9BURK|nr:alpha/beta hydrolase-fold protein [Lampropedia hyalina]SHE51673.1 hypothetical protein SAMN02745117_00433 [Lampropedia hyalina DSM 16112]
MGIPPPLHPNDKRRRCLLGMAALAGTALAPTIGAAEPVPPASVTGTPITRPHQQAQLPPEQIQHERVSSFLLESSRHPGEPWRIHLARPVDASRTQGYSIVYLLDGNASFPLAWHALQSLQTHLPSARQLVLVGIGYPAHVRFDVQRRFYDFTPPTAEEHLRGRKDTRTGGQDAFLDFIEHDLRPAIGQRLAIHPQRQALFGHSLGGLLTLHALYTRPHLFQIWMAADPSTWWNGQSIHQEHTAFLAGVHAAGNRFQNPAKLLLQRSSESGRGTKQPERIAATPHDSRRMEILNNALELARIEGLEVFYQHFAHESHPSMLAPAIKDGLSLLLGTTPAALQRIEPQGIG